VKSRESKAPKRSLTLSDALRISLPLPTMERQALMALSAMLQRLDAFLRQAESSDDPDCCSLFVSRSKFVAFREQWAARRIRSQPDQRPGRLDHREASFDGHTTATCRACGTPGDSSRTPRRSAEKRSAAPAGRRRQAQGRPLVRVTLWGMHIATTAAMFSSHRTNTPAWEDPTRSQMSCGGHLRRHSNHVMKNRGKHTTAPVVADLAVLLERPADDRNHLVQVPSNLSDDPCWQNHRKMRRYQARSRRLVSWEPLANGALRGFRCVDPPIGLKLFDYPVLLGPLRPWASLPSKLQIDREDRQKKDANGKRVFEPLLEWRARDLGDRFSTALIALVRTALPDALDGSNL
jgi:hypothetical protein